MTVIGDALRGGTPFSGEVMVRMKNIDIPVYVIAHGNNLSIMYTLRLLDGHATVHAITNSYDYTSSICTYMPVLSRLLDIDELSFILSTMTDEMRCDVDGECAPGIFMHDGTSVYVCDSDRSIGYQGNVIYREKDGPIHIGELRGITMFLPTSLILYLQDTFKDGGQSLYDQIEEMGYNIEEKDPIPYVKPAFQDICFF